MEVLRRLVSSSLLLLFSLMLLAPLLGAIPATAEENLPACCRRDGNHHCAKRAPVATAPASAVNNAPTRCGQYPAAAALSAANAAIPVAAVAPAIERAAALALVPARFLALPSQSTPAAPLRGPPALFA
jgi:hypothetical protein